MKPKKLPKWAIPVAVAAAVGIIVISKKRKPSHSNATEPGSEGLSNQSFIPVTGENVPGAGANYYPSQSSNSNESVLVNFLKEQNEERTTQRFEERQEGTAALEREQSFFADLISSLNTGGGAPTSNGAPGISVAPAPEAATPPTPPPYTPPPTVAPSIACPASYPIYNPANGAPGPHSCWRYSRDKCSGGKFKHAYEDGHYVCATV